MGWHLHVRVTRLLDVMSSGDPNKTQADSEVEKKVVFFLLRKKTLDDMSRECYKLFKETKFHVSLFDWYLYMHACTGSLFLQGSIRHIRYSEFGTTRLPLYHSMILWYSWQLSRLNPLFSNQLSTLFQKCDNMVAQWRVYPIRRNLCEW